MKLERKTVSGIILMLLLMAVSTSMFNFHLVKATPTITITIKDDGTVDPFTAPIDRYGDVYNFTGDITYPTYYGILVKKGNIIIDGAGYVVEGSVTGKGFELDSISNVTIKNTGIKGFKFGIFLNSTVNNTISGNNITNNNYDGIELDYSSNYNNIHGNIITNNNYGVRLYDSSYNDIHENNITNNNYDGIELSYSSNYNNIHGNNITNKDYGVSLDDSSYNDIHGNIITSNEVGVRLYDSSYNDIHENNITNNNYGVDNWNSSYNDIHGNIITNNEVGVGLDDSSYNDIHENNITNNNYDGIELSYSSNYNNIHGNIITNNEYGVSLDGSSYNYIRRNNIINNEVGIELVESSNNKFFHNNFIDNTKQVDIFVSGYVNFWDDGYPSEGNYWSDYEQRYPDANELDNSGIWNTPYFIDEDNQDNYPLVEPYSPPTLTIWSLPTGVTFTVDDMSRTTPWSEPYYDPISVSLEMPEIHTVGDARHYWNQWSDGNTSRSRTVIMDSDITLTAQYSAPYYQLTVTSSPMTGITFTVDGFLQTTPYVKWILEGSYTLEMPETHDGYNWSHWLEDGNTDTSRIKSVTMDRGITLTGVFVDITPPTISIHFPGNKTYHEGNVPLFFIVSESTSWIGYSLDNQMNVTIYGNTTISDLSNRIHTLTVYANDTAGNMGSSDIVYFTFNTSAPDISPPIVLIFSPKNKTYTTTDIPLTVIVDETVSWMACSLDDQANMTFSETTTLYGLSNGLHRLIAYANDTAGNMGASETVYFTVDTVPPNIEIISPENKTYTTSSVSLTFTLNEPISWIGYSLDGQANVTIAGNTTLSDLPDGSHSLIVYANDTFGNMGASETIYFSIDTQQRPEPFPMWIVAVIVIVAAFGTAVYLLRIRKKS